MKKGYFRKAVSVLLCVLILGSLSGCHGSEGLPSFEMPREFDTSREYDIVFWAKNDTNITQTRIYKKAIEDFEALYPNIHVTIKLYTDYRLIYNDVITNISTNTTPNVCISYPDHIATYMSGVNVMVPLDELMADPRYGLDGSLLRYEGAGELVANFAADGVIGGHTYALPFMRSTEACYINKTYVEKMGYEIPDILTWDFVWEVSEAAMEKDENGLFKVNGQNVMIPFIYKSTDNMMIQMLRQRDAGYSTENGDILMFNDTARQMLYEIAYHAGTGAFSTFKISSYPGNFLNAGQCLFAVDSTAGATWMGSDAPLSDISADKFVRFETAVRPVPQYDPENISMIAQGPSLCIFNKEDPQEVMASWLFLQFLLTNEVQTAYSRTEGYVPVTRKAMESEDYLDYLSRAGEDNDEHYTVKIEAAKILIDNVESTFITPVFNGSASLRDAAGQLIENAAKSARRKETVDDAYFDKMFADVRSLYHLDQLPASGGVKEDLGELPKESKMLLLTLAFVWVILIAVRVRGRIASRGKK